MLRSVLVQQKPAHPTPAVDWCQDRAVLPVKLQLQQINQPQTHQKNHTSEKKPQTTHTVLWLHQSGFVSLYEKGQENPNILATASLGMLSLQTGNDKTLMPTGIQDRNRNRIHTAPPNPRVTKFSQKNAAIP